jgi:hypothetical protein
VDCALPEKPITYNLIIGLDAVTTQRLREGHSYSTNYATGEIYRQIRRCQSEKSKVTEERWRGRLSALTEGYLKKLLKRDRLVTALDKILPFRGLWKHFQLGSMDIFLSIRCDEVCLLVKLTLHCLIHHSRKSPIISIL